MTPDILQRLQKARADGRAVCLVTSEAHGSDTLLSFEDIRGQDTPMAEAARRALQLDQQQLAETDSGRVFLTPFNPPIHIFIVGAVHITQALLPLLSVLEFDATVIDPRGAFARQERFAGAHVITQWPDEALKDVTIGHRNAVITLTHDPKLDDPALQTALASDAFYIGALGSRRTHAKRLERLMAAGFTENQMQRISAPVGLDIGARSPAEIAMSIAADIIQALRQPAA